MLPDLSWDKQAETCKASPRSYSPWSEGSDERSVSWSPGQVGFEFSNNRLGPVFCPFLPNSL